MGGLIEEEHVANYIKFKTRKNFTTIPKIVTHNILNSSSYVDISDHC